jgi:hypothetical protein
MNFCVTCPQEILGFMSVTLALRPEPKERAEQQSQQQDSKAVAALESQAVARGLGMVLQLDIAMDAPVIVMPRGSESKDKVRLPVCRLQDADSGITLSLMHALQWHHAGPNSSGFGCSILIC